MQDAVSRQGTQLYSYTTSMSSLQIKFIKTSPFTMASKMQNTQECLWWKHTKLWKPKLLWKLNTEANKTKKHATLSESKGSQSHGDTPILLSDIRNPSLNAFQPLCRHCHADSKVHMQLQRHRTAKAIFLKRPMLREWLSWPTAYGTSTGIWVQIPSTYVKSWVNPGLRRWEGSWNWPV